VVGVVVAVLPIARGAGVDPVLKLNEALIADLTEAGAAPAWASRALAIYHFSMWNAMARAEQAGLAEEEQVIAVAAAAATVGNYFYPKGEAATVATAFGPGSAAAIKIGQDCAAELVTSRQSDGSEARADAPGREGIGEWRHTPPDYQSAELPQWGNVRPFTLTNPDLFLPDGPPDLVSEAYTDALEEVKAIGGRRSEVRTREQTVLAYFWSDFRFTETPPGHWNAIARDLAVRNELSFGDGVRLFATMNLAMADAGIVVWRAKYEYRFWRPVDAIRNGWDDGNPETEGEAEWESLLPSPPHPEYPSGHAGFSGAASEVLSQFFGSDDQTFTVTSGMIPGYSRTYRSLWGCALEVATSRVYCGIHFSFSGVDGVVTGRRVGATVWEACGEPRVTGR
jgi:membrane-associated phospholipid phosphatase